MKRKLLFMLPMLALLTRGVLAAGVLDTDKDKIALIKTAMAEGDKALQANEAGKAKFGLLAVTDLCFDDMGWRREVPEDIVPEQRYNGGDAEELKQAMKQAFLKSAHDDEKNIVRLSLMDADWEERAVLWSGINNAQVGWYKFIDGAIVLKKPDGKCWVYECTFARKWTGTGDKYGDLSCYYVAARYEILPENVSK